MTTYYLDSNSNANSLYSDGRLTISTPDSEDQPNGFTYDPMNPVPSHGGNVCCTGNAIEGGALDQQGMETRHGILVYTTERRYPALLNPRCTFLRMPKIPTSPLSSSMCIPTGPPTTCMRPSCGHATVKGMTIMEEAEVYKLNVTPLATSNYFKKGHRISIEISSSNFPRFARNLNTGGDNYDEKEGVVAHNEIHHSDEHPSQIKIPIVAKNEP